ncbi:hypothetical protein SUGI_0239230 [Cryptomeria japonica]|uniref:tetraspanin-8 n=1 Tax=Cryptomeria japonica TaxID=3369 RepID=UPI002408A064|nr:tetraspanin-8 [Cryptomeria japonica]GLJ14754.1 hypothetical protein SUGI_0239230 [Cryptomeria japonica]
MARVSNKIIATINFLAFLLSLWILRQGIWLANKGTTDCERFLQWPVIGLGAFVMLLSVAGFVGACFRLTWALSLYLVLLSSLIVLMLIGFIVFAFSVTYKGDGRNVEGREYKEYRLGDYSKWLQGQVDKNYSWNKIKSCLKEARICKSLAENEVNAVAEQFYKTHLSPIQSGCCKPPTSCQFKYINATVWEKKPEPINNTDPDCKTWSNNQDILCYDCKSCKAGVVDNLKRDWRKLIISALAVTVALIAIYSAGCRACINNSKEKEFEYAVYRMTLRCEILKFKDFGVLHP